MADAQLALTIPPAPPTCSHEPCREPIARSGMCKKHRAQIDPDYLARFDLAWDNQGREDWFKMTDHLYDVWWANDRGQPVPPAPQLGRP